MFNANLLAPNHSDILQSSLLITCSSKLLSILQNKVVSSAYMTMLNTLLTRGKLFMAMRKSKGLKIDPCGTPLVTGRSSD